MTSYIMSGKEVSSNSSVTTILPEKFYGEMVCTWIVAVRMFASNLVDFLSNFFSVRIYY